MIWKAKRNRDRNHTGVTDKLKRRSRGPERLEPRRMLAADALTVGLVYLETDYLETDQDVGGDSRGDRFILSFSGGVPDTELSEVRIRTDKDGDGITVGDPIFDTAQGGRGKDGAQGFEIVRVLTADGHTVTATAEVEDGGQELVLRLSNFQAGDRLEFTIDVDEVLRNAIDLAVFNDRLDVITSGQEFQDSILEATFNAPHYETSFADAIFLNEYGDPAQAYGLNLPPDDGTDIDSRPNRSAAAVASAAQVPKPIEISGYVWLDNDLDAIREPGETLLEGVEISLWKKNDSGVYVDTGFRVSTEADGRYRFPKSLGLQPGNYRLVETQPEGLYSVAAVTGSVNGSPAGTVESLDLLSEINIPLGDLSATNYDFAETGPASLSGFVYQDNDNDGRREAGETGIAGVRVQLIPLSTIAPQSTLTVTTSSDGSYSFLGLAPGSYEVIEIDQPADLIDGIDSPGRIGSRVVGIAEDSGDRIGQITLNGSDVGVEYNFGEVPFGSLSGFVYLARPGSDCDGDHAADEETPLPGVRIELLDAQGLIVARTTTGVDGAYRFDRVLVGDYQIVEFTPVGRIDGESHAGLIDDLLVGASINGGLIQSITMTPGGVGVAYNFCEGSSASISGYVYEDRSNDGRRDVGEDPIDGASVSLVGTDGTVIAEQRTDSNGLYKFVDLPPGEYSVVEQQPANYLDGIDTVGNVRGRVVGRVGGNDTLTTIHLNQGDDAVGYNFGELLAATLSGSVHADTDGDCETDEDKEPLAGVSIRLLDVNGKEVARTTTDTNGQYSFANLRQGEYTIKEIQPEGWLNGGQRAGSGGGDDSVANMISQVSLVWAEQLVQYDFCEIAPAEIGGSVWQESDFDRRFDSGEVPVPGVLIELIDDGGDVVATTRTNAEGSYRFVSLVPGVYSVRESQPGSLFHGGEVVGDGGGEIGGDDLLIGITLGGGAVARGYNFPEVPPASLSGFVFQDGAAIELGATPDPADLRQYRDGLLTADDTRLAGVVLELRNVLGRPVDASRALAGTYAEGPIRATTDQDGFYEFSGLRPGTYHVYQVQPDGFVDGLDTPGTTGGIAVNPADEQNDSDRIMIQTLAFSEQTDPHDDAILNISLVSGDSSAENNFSEIVIADSPLPLREFDPQPPTPRVTAPIETFDPTIRLITFADPSSVTNVIYANDELAVSWHLSVIDGGFPRGKLGQDGIIRSASFRKDPLLWRDGNHDRGRWTIANDGTPTSRADSFTLGEENATALAGDFDGDGRDEAVIYVAGQWFVDLNGNGIWDSGDLWIQLGTAHDRPVVGDWNGDGKDDVGIFGRQWQHDPQRIVRDPGLPDAANMRRRHSAPKALAAHQQDDPDWTRRLRRGSQGALREDAVDHVFKYGEQDDTPLAGDWNGNGIDQIAVFRAGKWLLDADGDGRWTINDERVEFGRPGDAPIVGDFNGDEIDEIGVVRGDVWIIDTDGDRKITGNDLRIVVPRPSDESQPVVGDFDGDGKDEPGYYDESA